MNIQPAPDPNLRNFVTHSRTIAEFAEATGIYALPLSRVRPCPIA